MSLIRKVYIGMIKHNIKCNFCKMLNPVYFGWGIFQIDVIYTVFLIKAITFIKIFNITLIINLLSLTLLTSSLLFAIISAILYIKYNKRLFLILLDDIAK